MIAGKAGLPERVDDQPGRVAIRVREQRGVRRSVWPEEPLMAPPPRTERLQGPAAVGLLSALDLRDQWLLLPQCQHVLQSRRCQQQPHSVEEVLRGASRLQIATQLVEAGGRVGCGARGVGGDGSDGQGRERGAIVRGVGALEWLEAEVEPVPRSVGPYRLP